MNPNAIQCNRTRQSSSPEVNPPSPPLDGLSSPHSMNASKLSVASSSSVDGVAAENIQPTNNVLAEITIKSECNERKRPYTVSALLDLPQFSPFSSNGGDSVER
ncbi:hypothetical protein AB6A40_009306 [Gnathostoma spinigerum]|uniref:Uncharacterized protein n=1 Tax=Gnathostoma spinigerum TaxID=75299 RepID=A0ABD6F0K3_9BILA